MKCNTAIQSRMQALFGGKSSSFTKHVITLASGTTLAQIISIGIVPLLTRLYSPHEFGIYAVFTSSLSVLGIFATGRYEYAVISEEKDGEAWHCLILVFLIALFSCLLVLLIGLPLSGWIGDFLGIEATPSIVASASAALFFTGAHQGAYYWLNRHKRYRQISASMIVGALCMAAVSGLLGYLGLGAEGLIYGFMAGQIANFAVLFRSIMHHDRSLRLPQWRHVVVQALKHKDFPRFLIPSSVLDRFSSQSHIILLSSLFGASVSGALGLYQRVVSLPVRLVRNSFGDVFKQYASVQLNERGECRALFTKVALKLLALGLLPFFVLLLAAPELFALVFGEQWRTGGEYAQILSWMFLFGFVISPLSSLFFIGKKQKFDLVMQIFLIIGTVSALLAGAHWFKSVHLALAFFTIVYCVKYLLEGWLAWRIAKGEI